MLPMRIMEIHEARQKGYVSLTTPYPINSKNEEVNERAIKWLSTVLSDLRGTNSVIVEIGNSVEVFRHKSELNTIEAVPERLGLTKSGVILKKKKP